MLNHAAATGVAIERILSRNESVETPVTAAEISEYVELARVRLQLDNAAVTAAMMFAQPLLEIWDPHWKFAYTVALSLGAKYTTEGFFVIDIINHLTNEFSLEALKEGERVALYNYDWNTMHRRVRVFRNALVNVSLETPMAPAANHTPPPTQPDDFGLHVLILDDSPMVCELHEHMVRTIRPDARIRTCQTVEAAHAYLQQCEERQDYVTLTLLDFHLAAPGEEPQQPALTFQQIVEQVNGFHVADAIDQADAPGRPAPLDFRYKPLVAIISSHADQIAVHQPVDADGIMTGCDVLLPKPVNVDLMRVLVEGCGV